MLVLTDEVGVVRLLQKVEARRSKDRDECEGNRILCLDIWFDFKEKMEFGEFCLCVTSVGCLELVTIKL
jgi:hypothetical protein